MPAACTLNPMVQYYQRCHKQTILREQKKKQYDAQSGTCVHACRGSCVVRPGLCTAKSSKENHDGRPSTEPKRVHVSFLITSPSSPCTLHSHPLCLFSHRHLCLSAHATPYAISNDDHNCIIVQDCTTATDLERHLALRLCRRYPCHKCHHGHA